MSGPAVLVAVFTIGTCGLIYELLAGTLASYVLGDSVFQFSTIIGVYLFAMGVGAWLSGFVAKDVVARFIEIEVAVALVGGTSAAVLFASFARVSFFSIVLYGLVFVIGTLVGLEIPLLMRILKDQYDLKDLISRVLTVDYLGALVASLAFPIFVVPKLGLVRGAFVVGALNAVVAVWCTHLLKGALRRPGRVWFLRAEAYLTLALLIVGIAYSDTVTTWSEDALYADPVVFAKTTPYQRLVVTQGRSSYQLYINGALQLASADEHRYHEALVHPVMAVARARAGGTGARRVLVLGGGDGLAVRELLEHPGLESVTLVDLDPTMTELARSFPLFVRQNRGSLLDPRVTVVNADAFVWIGAPERATEPRYDAVVVDFPDPSSFSLGKLYTRRFYRMLKRVVSDDGAVVVQATSPMYARRAFWCVATTMEAAGFTTRAYHTAVPSFGEWGYILAAPGAFEVPSWLPDAPLKFLTPETMASLFVLSADMARVPAEVNRLNNQVLVGYHEADWARWN
ncbi:MAG: polyamine aminopropyltransferase [Myxococcales bacterium]|nr:polyamine aminopropyltransferase [Myxococcales bacterium]MCB9649666.1 polyamine aminopropyltransferase [Deltaproteobacteria bacterium]